ncbi:MAG TPA: hypothetical protein VL134_01470 [Leptolyngbya sp.]|jgi:hypothetical protein|nr:hypothetical protein [Leptolyngbya sp.]
MKLIRSDSSGFILSVPNDSQSRSLASMDRDYVLYSCFACTFPILVLAVFLSYRKYQQHLKRVHSNRLLANIAMLERLLKLDQPPKRL